jgi:CRP-like cAMP-binding protein
MSAEEEISLLRALPLFAGIEPEALRILTYSTERRSLKPGDVLYAKGEYSDGAYLVMDGEIVLDPSDDGAPSPHHYGRGTLIGQLGLFIRVERSTTALSRGMAKVSFISRDLMVKVLASHPESAARIRANLAQRLDGLMRELDAVPL